MNTLTGLAFTLLGAAFAGGAFGLNEEKKMARHGKSPQTYTPGWPVAKPDGTVNWGYVLGEALAWALLAAAMLLLLAGAGASIL